MYGICIEYVSEMMFQSELWFLSPEKAKQEIRATWPERWDAWKRENRKTEKTEKTEKTRKPRERENEKTEKTRKPRKPRKRENREKQKSMKIISSARFSFRTFFIFIFCFAMFCHFIARPPCSLRGSRSKVQGPLFNPTPSDKCKPQSVMYIICQWQYPFFLYLFQFPISQV